MLSSISSKGLNILTFVVGDPKSKIIISLGCLSSILFSTGTNVSNSCNRIIGFNNTDVSCTTSTATTSQKVIDLLASNDRVSLTEHHSTNEVFSFGRDQGLYGRILNQTVILKICGNGQ